MVSGSMHQTCGQTNIGCHVVTAARSVQKQLREVTKGHQQKVVPQTDATDKKLNMTQTRAGDLNRSARNPPMMAPAVMCCWTAQLAEYKQTEDVADIKQRRQVGRVGRGLRLTANGCKELDARLFHA